MVANDHNIEKISPTGLDLGNFSSDGVPFSQGIAFDGAGNLYAAKEYRIEKFSPTGDQVATITGPGLKSPDFIAFQVPEPSTVGLVALALPVFALYRWIRRNPKSQAANFRRSGRSTETLTPVNNFSVRLSR